jgi:hypothetical protein
MKGWTHLTFAAILLAPGTALAAIVRSRDARMAGGPTVGAVRTRIRPGLNRTQRRIE